MNKLQELIEKSLPGVITAGALAVAASVVQVAVLRSEVQSLRNDISRLEKSVERIVDRSAYFHGEAERSVLAATAPTTVALDAVLAAEKEK